MSEYIKRTKSSWIALLLAAPLALYFWFGYQHLGQFETADEYRWIYDSTSRIPQYWTAMQNKDWEHTLINDKPGVSTAIVSGLGLRYAGDLNARFVERGEHTTNFNPQGVQTINSVFRLPILAFNGLLAVLWYFMLRRLLDDNWTALLACSLILLSPILIGISQIVNPDSLLWSTSFTAIIAFLVFLKERKWYDILVAGIFMGFALLSKYTTIIIIPYWFGLIAAYLIYRYDQFIEEKVFRKRVIQFVLGLGIAAVLTGAIYAWLLPAVRLLSLNEILKLNDAFYAIYPYLQIITYIAGALLLDAIILKSWFLKKLLWPFKYLWGIGFRAIYAVVILVFSAVILNWMKNNLWKIADIPFDAGSDVGFQALPLAQRIFLEIKPLAFSLTPIVLVLTAFTLLLYIVKSKPQNAFVVFALSVLPMIFYAAVLREGYLVHIRYSLMLYPPMMVIAAIGIMEVLPKIRWRPLLAGFVFSLAVGLSVISIHKIYPFYFNYTNDLLPKSDVITTAWGYGGYEAAQYIQKQSQNPDQVIVWTDYDGFCPFFPGKCIKDSDIKWVGYRTTNQIGYYVVTPRGSAKFADTWQKMTPNIDSDPDWRIDIGDRPNNFIEVFRVQRSNFTSNNWWRK